MNGMLAMLALGTCALEAVQPAAAQSTPQVAPQPTPPAAAQQTDGRPDITVSAADRSLAIGNLVKAIREQHFSAVEGERIARAIERSARSSRYTTITSGRQLAATLTQDLRSVSGDPHFLVDYFARARPFPAPTADPDEGAQRRELPLVNYGVRMAERLEGNIGYLRLDRFAPARETAPVLQAAMRMLSATEALIIDLRANGGGNGDTATLLAGMLLPEPTRFGDVVERGGTNQIWTPIGLAEQYSKPVYVLISARTFSAAEGFAYNLRALHRVTVVGERTRGGANPVTRTLLSSRFWALVPVAQMRNAVTGRNWQGTGVTPDIESTADQALQVAQRHAARQLIERHTDDPLTRELQALVASR